jgi:hypothetical protein
MRRFNFVITTATKHCFVKTSTQEQAFDRTPNAHIPKPPELMDVQVHITIRIPALFSVEKAIQQRQLSEPIKGELNIVK